MCLPYDPAVAFFGVYPRRMKTVHSSFTHNSFKKKVNNLNVFQSVWLNKLPYPYVGILLSKKEEATDMCTTWMDVMGIILSEKKYLKRLHTTYLCL